MLFVAKLIQRCPRQSDSGRWLGAISLARSRIQPPSSDVLGSSARPPRVKSQPRTDGEADIYTWFNFERELLIHSNIYFVNAALPQQRVKTQHVTSSVADRRMMLESLQGASLRRTERPTDSDLLYCNLSPSQGGTLWVDLT